MEIGLTHTSSLIVSNEHLAITVGSGDLRVLSTPTIIALMENAAMLAVTPHLPCESTTVGGRIEVSHLHPTAEGKVVTATAVLTHIHNSKLTFDIIAKEEEKIIGEAKHLRFIVDREKFISIIYPKEEK